MSSPVGERLKHYRKLRKMSQEELAIALAIPLNTISKIEHGGRKVTLDEAVQLAEVLRISLDELAGVVTECPPRFAEVRHWVAQATKEGKTLLSSLQKLEAVTSS